MNAKIETIINFFKMYFEPYFLYFTVLILFFILLIPVILAKIRFKTAVKIFTCSVSLQLFAVLSFDFISNFDFYYAMQSVSHYVSKITILLTILLLIMGVHFKTVIKVSTCIILLLYFWVISIIVFDVIFDRPDVFLSYVEENLFAKKIFRNLYLAFFFFFILFNLEVLYLYCRLILLSKEMQLWHLLTILLTCCLCLEVLDSLNFLPIPLFWRSCSC